MWPRVFLILGSFTGHGFLLVNCRAAGTLPRGCTMDAVERSVCGGGCVLQLTPCCRDWQRKKPLPFLSSPSFLHTLKGLSLPGHPGAR
jgi:hypothetical protein